MTSTGHARVAVDCRNVLGEGAFWDHRRQLLWWVDVPIPSSLWCLEPNSGRLRQYSMPQMITCARSKADGSGLILACHSGVGAFNLETEAFKILVEPEPELPFNRSNDAGTDALGRLWFGTMQNNLSADGGEAKLVMASGGIFSLDVLGNLRKHEDGLLISNTVCWSPDNKTMYFGDTGKNTIFAYDFDLDDGVISNKRAFAAFGRGIPDGSCVDTDGCLWNARVNGACVVRFNPRGEVDTVVEVDALHATSCAFGGASMTDLYITTASFGLSHENRTVHPLSGAVFVARPGAQGVAAFEFGVSG